MLWPLYQNFALHPSSLFLGLLLQFILSSELHLIVQHTPSSCLSHTTAWDPSTFSNPTPICWSFTLSVISSSFAHTLQCLISISSIICSASYPLCCPLLVEALGTWSSQIEEDSTEWYLCFIVSPAGKLLRNLSKKLSKSCWAASEFVHCCPPALVREFLAQW